MSFKYTGVDMEGDGEVDQRGSRGVQGVRPYFNWVKLRIRVHTDESEERFRRLIKNVEYRCPVMNLFKSADVDVDVRWERVPFVTLKLTVNGAIEYEVRSEPDTPLVYVLRDELKLKGTKLGCGLEQCGSLRGFGRRRTRYCPASHPCPFSKARRSPPSKGIAEQRDGASGTGCLHVDASAAMQCGYCTAGMVVATTASVGRTTLRRPAEQITRKALTPHLCRCGSHPRVLRAVEASGEDMSLDAYPRIGDWITVRHASPQSAVPGKWISASASQQLCWRSPMRN